MMISTDIQKRVEDASRRIDQQNPARLRQNIGATCYEHTSRTIDLLNSETPLEAGRFYHVGKTRGEGQYTPIDWRPLRVAYRDGVWDLSGVSHDACMFVPTEPGAVTGFPFGVQFDLVGGGNDGDTPIGHPGTPTAGLIARENYRPNNPPISPGEWLLSPAPGPTPPPSGVGTIQFPPRDAELRFFDALNAFYSTKGRANRTNNGADRLHVDNEGLVVWLSEFIRHYNDTRSEVTATERTLADVAAAWQ